MHWSRRVAVICFLLLGAQIFAHAQEHSWLLGQWELKFDPDHSPKDFLEFGGSGQVTSISPQGRLVSGLYSVKDDGVKVSLALPNGKALPLLFVPSQDKRQLRLKSSKTGSISVYEKSKP